VLCLLWSECILVVSVLARASVAGRGLVGGIVTMSDDDHHFESKADAGASKTFPQQAGTIRKNAYLVIKTRPCKVRPSFPSSRLRTSRRLSFKGFIRCTGLIFFVSFMQCGYRLSVFAICSWTPFLRRCFLRERVICFVFVVLERRGCASLVLLAFSSCGRQFSMACESRSQFFCNDLGLLFLVP
jgi:hypothetical protein